MLLVAVVGVGTVAAGCAARENPAPPPASPPSSRAVSLPYGGAPKVENPLPPTVLSGDPCREALTPEQLREILGKTDPPKPEDLAATGPACRWDHTSSGAGMNVFYDTRTRQGLSAVYRNTQPLMTTWKPMTIGGFPAVAYGVYTGIGLDDTCAVAVGIADDYTVDAALNLGRAKAGKADPCDITARVADIVLGNLRRKAGR